MESEQTAAATFDAIRQGGVNLLLSVHQNINEAEEWLEKGDFTRAQVSLSAAVHIVSQLAHAQVTLGIVAKSQLRNVSELEVGMKLAHIGTVTEINSRTCEDEDCPGHYAVTVDDGQSMRLDGDNQLYVEQED